MEIAVSGITAIEDIALSSQLRLTNYVLMLDGLPFWDGAGGVKKVPRGRGVLHRDAD